MKIEIKVGMIVWEDLVVERKFKERSWVLRHPDGSPSIVSSKRIMKHLRG